MSVSKEADGSTQKMLRRRSNDKYHGHQPFAIDTESSCSYSHGVFWKRRRECVYFVLFLLMVMYHFYVTHLLLTSTTVPMPNPVTAPEPAAVFNNPFHRNVSPLFSSLSTNTIPLEELTESSISSMKCPSPLVYMPNTPLRVKTISNATAISTTRKIPKIVHMTAKSRCISKAFADNMKLWHFPDHQVYLHDDQAVDRLLVSQGRQSSFLTPALNESTTKGLTSLQQSTLTPSSSLFPHIPIARKCLRSGAGLADLWRYLVLWEYGGIYTDIDNAPGEDWSSTTIQDDDDAVFVIEKLGVLSQYFLAISPKHPLMYLAIQVSLHRVLALDHVGKQNIPVVTGPGALKVAFKYFMRTQEKLSSEGERKWKENNSDGRRYGRVQSGVYYGVGNRSVTILGTKDTGSRWVVRGSVTQKGAEYEKMGMKHFSQLAKKKFNESCLVHLWNLDFNLQNFNATNW